MSSKEMNKDVNRDINTEHILNNGKRFINEFFNGQGPDNESSREQGTKGTVENH